MDEDLGDLPHGHVHVTAGSISHVNDATECDLPGERVGGRGRIVSPGFVETHWHLWNTILRGLASTTASSRAYFELKDRLAPLFRPIDTYNATMISLAEGLQAGITTVHNWNHNTRSPEDAEASRRAHQISGGRARFSYSRPHERTHDGMIDAEDLRRVATDWLLQGKSRMLTVGMTGRNPNALKDPSMSSREWEIARELDIPITFHSGGPRSNRKRYADLPAMHRKGLLGHDVQLVHAVHATPDEIQLLADTGTHLSLCPMTQVRDMGGAPPLTQLLDAGVLVSLSIDTTASVTAADMFLQMRGAFSIELLRNPESWIVPRHLLQMATIDGARDLGFDDVVGSLTPGKRADLLVIDTNTVNMSPCPAPVEQLVLAARPDNIERVYVDGKLLVHRGDFTDLNDEEIISDAKESQAHLLAAAGWDPSRWDTA